MSEEPALIEQIKSLTNRAIIAHRYGSRDDVAQVVIELHALSARIREKTATETAETQGKPTD